MKSAKLWIAAGAVAALGLLGACRDRTEQEPAVQEEPGTGGGGVGQEERPVGEQPVAPETGQPTGTEETPPIEEEPGGTTQPGGTVQPGEEPIEEQPGELEEEPVEGGEQPQQ